MHVQIGCLSTPKRKSNISIARLKNIFIFQRKLGTNTIHNMPESKSLVGSNRASVNPKGNFL